MKIRITMEYELEGDVAQEQEDWIKGNVSFQDVWELFSAGEEGYKVKFETVD